MFTRMQEGTADDWAIIGAAHQEHFKKTPAHLMDMLKSLENVTVGFACDQLQHSLMTGTLARRASPLVSSPLAQSTVHSRPVHLRHIQSTGSQSIRLAPSPLVSSPLLTPPPRRCEIAGRCAATLARRHLLWSRKTLGHPAAVQRWLALAILLHGR